MPFGAQEPGFISTLSKRLVLPEEEEEEEVEEDIPKHFDTPDPNIPQEEEGEKEMDHISRKATASLAACKDCGLDGLDMAVCQQAAEEIVTAAKKALGDSYPVVLDAPALKHVTPFILAEVVHMGASVMDTQVPHAEFLQEKAKQAMRGTAKDAWQDALALFRPFLVQMVSELKDKATDALPKSE